MDVAGKGVDAGDGSLRQSWAPPPAPPGVGYKGFRDSAEFLFEALVEVAEDRTEPFALESPRRVVVAWEFRKSLGQRALSSFVRHVSR